MTALSVILYERHRQTEDSEEKISRNRKMFEKWDIRGIAELERNL